MIDAEAIREWNLSGTRARHEYATVVPTKATVELARAMIAEARRQESGAEAVILRYDDCRPEQLPALMALILNASLGHRIRHEGPVMGRPAVPLMYTEAGRRAAHAAWLKGDRSNWATVGHREYKRVAARRTRERARGARGAA